MSGYPVKTEVLVEGQYASLLHQKDYQRRIESLFDVHVTVDPLPSSKLHYKDRCDGGELVVKDEEESGWVCVRGKSEESCLKTQKYVLALSKPDYKCVVSCGPQLMRLLFQDNPQLRDAIEKEFEVFLSPVETGICVQGSQVAVTLTVSKLQSLSNTMTTTNQRMNLQIPGREQQFMTPNATTSHDIYQPSHDTHQPILDQELQKLLMRDPAMAFDTLKKVLMDGWPRSSTEQSTSNTHVHDSTTQDSKPVKPLSSVYRKRIQQFISLGFQAEQVESVIESLGPDASDNDIMARLVKLTPTPEKCSPVRNTSSRPSTGEFVPQPAMNREGLRPIVIDGSNVAMKHGNGKVFSCMGIFLAVDWFLKRGHSEITVFVPQWRKEPSRQDNPIQDQEILLQLEKAGYVKFTPSRRIGNRKIVCYDDRFIVELAVNRGGVIVSSDNFRDLVEENPAWRYTIENRLLQFVFVEDTFMVPQDPLGRQGPVLDSFLRFDGDKSPTKESMYDQSVPKDKQPCPYKEKCTFGPRCRYYHPEREQKMREKEVQQQQEENDSHSVSPGNVSVDSWIREKMATSSHEMKGDELAVRLQQLALSPQKQVYTHPISRGDVYHERPGGLQGIRYSHPQVQHHPDSPMIPMELSRNTSDSISYLHPSHEQWSGRSRDDRPPSGTIARGVTDRHLNPMEVGYTQYTELPLTTVNPFTTFTHHQYHYTHSHPHTHPQLVPAHVRQEYQPPTSQHHLHSMTGTDPLSRRGFHSTLSSRPHSANVVGYGGYPSHYVDQREINQLQSLDSNRRYLYDKAVEYYPENRERIRALLLQYPSITDMKSLLKIL